MMPGAPGQGHGEEFLKRVCSDPQYLEVVSGIVDIMSKVDLDLCIESDDEF
jgi:hypothetical protein